jgi:hypothetical protein
MMNLTELQRKLLATARSNPPSETVPYAFHTRVMARLREQAVPDGLALWASGLWRAAVPCLAIMILLGAWSYFATPATAPGDLSQEFENTVLAAANQQASDAIW